MTRRDRMMIMAVLAVALVGGFWMLVMKPQRAAATDAAAQVEAARATLLQAQQQVTAGKAAQAAYRRDRATFVKLGRVVPESDDIPTLIVQLVALAKKNHVTLERWVPSSDTAAAASGAATTSTTTPAGASGKDASSSTAAVAPLYPPGSVQMTGGLGRTPISFDLKGKYFDLERYLAAVQRFAVLSQKKTLTKGRLIVIDSFDFEPQKDASAKPGKKGSTPEIEAAMKASIYFAPPLQAPTASASASASAGTTAPDPSAASSSSATGTATVGDLQ